MRSATFFALVGLWIPLTIAMAWMTSQIMKQVDLNTANYVFSVETSSFATAATQESSSRWVPPPQIGGDTTTTHANVQSSPPSQPQQTRPTRILWSIFTMEAADDKMGLRYRNLFRQLFAVLPHDRVCPLPRVTRSCEIVYTFVVGRGGGGGGGGNNNNNNNNAPTAIRNLNLTAADFLIPSDKVQPRMPRNDTRGHTNKQDILPPFFPDDALHDDMTRLNIAENMDLDKSPTWFGYASKIVDEFDIDYVAKLDTDTLPILDEYFRFVQQELPILSAQGTNRIMAGILADTVTFHAHIPAGNYRDRANYLKPKYGNIPPHYYIRGEFYILSKQLVKDVYHTYVTNFPRFPHWNRRFEDQVITALVMASPGPLHAVMFAKSEAFWKHPVKLKPKKSGHCEALWKEQVNRLSG